MPKITIDEELLVACFDSLEGETHLPSADPNDCDECHLMWRIEQAVGRELTERRELDIVEIRSVRIDDRMAAEREEELEPA